MSVFGYYEQRGGNRKNSAGRRTQYVPIVTKRTINHEWRDKAGNVYNEGMTSIQTSVRYKCIKHGKGKRAYL